MWVKKLARPGTAHAICEDYRASASIDLDHDRADRAAGRKLVMPLRVASRLVGVLNINTHLKRDALPPDRVSLLFPQRTTRATPTPLHGYRTRVITEGVNPSLHIAYKRSHVKQYFKENRALRTETTINNAGDFHTGKGLKNLDHLRTIGHQINQKLLEIERVGENCALSQEALDRLQQSTVESGQRAPALHFGDARVMAMLHALCMFAHLPRGFRNADLRDHVAALLGVSQYTPGQMTYDLRRLRLKGLITRLPKTHRYIPTTYGLKVALFYTKVYLRILRPGWLSIGEPLDPIPRPLRDALVRVDAEVQRICNNARLRPVA